MKKISHHENPLVVQLKSQAKKLHSLLKRRIPDHISYIECLNCCAQLQGAKNWNSLRDQFENTVPTEVHPEMGSLRKSASFVEAKRMAEKLHSLLKHRIPNISYTSSLDFYAQLEGTENWKSFEMNFSIDTLDSLKEKKALKLLTESQIANLYEIIISPLKQGNQWALSVWRFLPYKCLWFLQALGCHVDKENCENHSLIFKKQKTTSNRNYLMPLPLPNETMLNSIEQYVKFQHRIKNTLFESCKSRNEARKA